MNDTDNASSQTKREEQQRLFDKLIMPHYGFIRKLCERYTLSKENVDENFNDVLLNFYIYITTYDDKRDLKNWIHVVTKRYVFSADAKRMKRDNASLLFPEFPCEDEMLNQDESFVVFETECFDGALTDGIMDALKKMPDINKRAFLLQLAGYSLKEITQILSKSGELESNNINTVKTRIFTARKYLRERVDREGNAIL